MVYSPVWVDAFAPPHARTKWMSYLQGVVPIGVMTGYALATGLGWWNEGWCEGAGIGDGDEAAAAGAGGMMAAAAQLLVSGVKELVKGPAPPAIPSVNITAAGAAGAGAAAAASSGLWWEIDCWRYVAPGALCCVVMC
jgi:hypothetical protein